eukprot:scaffold2636_cov340-Pavlova_lutheri.AAC.126
MALKIGAVTASQPREYFCTSIADSTGKLKVNPPKVVLQCLEERDADFGNITTASVRNIFQDLIQLLTAKVMDLTGGDGQLIHQESSQELNMLGLTRSPPT